MVAALQAVDAGDGVIAAQKRGAAWNERWQDTWTALVRYMMNRAERGTNERHAARRTVVAARPPRLSLKIICRAAVGPFRKTPSRSLTPDVSTTCHMPQQRSAKATPENR